METLKLLGRERIAIGQLPARQTALEPVLPLGRSAMGEAFRPSYPACILLQTFVADLTRGSHRFFKIAGLDHAEPVADPKLNAG